MAYQPLRLQTLQSMVTRNPFQHSKHLYRYDIQVLHYQLLMPSVGKWFCKKLILGVRGAKIDLLLRAVTKILLHVISRMSKHH